MVSGRISRSVRVRVRDRSKVSDKGGTRAKIRFSERVRCAKKTINLLFFGNDKVCCQKPPRQKPIGK